MRRISVVLIAILLAACDAPTDAIEESQSATVGVGAADLQSQRLSKSIAVAPPAAPPAPTPAPEMRAAMGRQIAQPSNGMLIRSGSARVEVKSLDVAITAVRALAARHNGFVANVAMQTGSEQLREATIELRLPSAQFDVALQGLQPLGKVESVNVTAEDVGEEFVDITARVTNARRLEERLIEMLRVRTGKLEEVLAVERELARVREEIERYTGRLRYLQSRVQMSTIAITVHEPVPVLASPGDNILLNAVLDAWRNFVRFIAGMIAASGVLVPLAIIGWLVWRLVRRYWPRVTTVQATQP